MTFMRNYKEKSSKQEPQGEHKSMADKAVDKFTQMMIDKLETIKASDWKQGWTNGSSATFGMPQNLTGRNYSGTNSFFLQMDIAYRYAYHKFHAVITYIVGTDITMVQVNQLVRQVQTDAAAL